MFTRVTKQSSKQVNSFLPTPATPAANAGSAWPTNKEVIWVICHPNKKQSLRASRPPIHGHDVGNVREVRACWLVVLCRCTTANHPLMGFMSCDEPRRWHCQAPEPLALAAGPIRPGQGRRGDSLPNMRQVSCLGPPVDGDYVRQVRESRWLAVLCRCTIAPIGFMSCNGLRRWRCPIPEPMWRPANMNARA